SVITCYRAGEHAANVLLRSGRRPGWGCSVSLRGKALHRAYLHPPPHPRFERLLSWVAPRWARRRAAARVARYRRAAWTRITAAPAARGRDRDHLPSRYGDAWRGSRFWQR